MANPYHHAVSSAKKWGGVPEDYIYIHDWFDESKMMMADFRHRALRHHAEGIFMCERIFGHAIQISGSRPLRWFEKVMQMFGFKIKTGRMIPVRWIGEQHVKEDCGFIPSMQDWFQHIKPQKWMGEPPVKLEKLLDKMDLDDEGTNEEKWNRYVGEKLVNR
jgi:hypothetical protein